MDVSNCWSGFMIGAHPEHHCACAARAGETTVTCSRTMRCACVSHLARTSVSRPRLSSGSWPLRGRPPCLAPASKVSLGRYLGAALRRHDSRAPRRRTPVGIRGSRPRQSSSFAMRVVRSIAHAARTSIVRAAQPPKHPGEVGPSTAAVSFDCSLPVRASPRSRARLPPMPQRRASFFELESAVDRAAVAGSGAPVLRGLDHEARGAFRARYNATLRSSSRSVAIVGRPEGSGGVSPLVLGCPRVRRLLTFRMPDRVRSPEDLPERQPASGTGTRVAYVPSVLPGPRKDQVIRSRV